MRNHLQALVRQLYPRDGISQTIVRHFHSHSVKSYGDAFLFYNDEEENQVRTRGVVNTHDKIPRYPSKVTSLSNSKVLKVYAGHKHGFTSGKRVPVNWVEPLEKAMEASWVVHMIYEFSGECNDLVVLHESGEYHDWEFQRQSYYMVPPFEYEGVFSSSKKQISFTASAFQVTPYYGKGDKLILVTCAHNIVPYIKNNNKVFKLTEIIACHVDNRELDDPRVFCNVLKDGNIDRMAQVASADDYAFLIAREIASDDQFPNFFIPKPVSAVINTEEKALIAENATDGYDHLVIGYPAPVTKTYINELNKQFKATYSAKRINFLLGADYRSVSLGQVVDHLGETYNHTCGTSPGSSGSATVVLESPIFEKCMTPFPEVLTFQGIHIGGGILNYAFSIDNKNFHCDYLEHVVNSLSHNQLQHFSAEQAKILSEYTQLYSSDKDQPDENPFS